MKHLKYFESNWEVPFNIDKESKEDIQTLKEILIELNDIGYDTYVFPSPVDLSRCVKFPDIAVNISPPKKVQLTGKELRCETILRMMEYMKSRRYKDIITSTDLHQPDPERTEYYQMCCFACLPSSAQDEGGDISLLADDNSITIRFTKNPIKIL